MKINYVEHKSGKKLFSFHRYDYKEYGNWDDFVMIDGGWDYVRYSGLLKEADVSEVFEDIREQFQWGKNKNKDGSVLEKTQWILLKDLETDHLEAILQYFLENKNCDHPNYQILKYELEYRKTL